MPSFRHPRESHLYYLSPIWLINLAVLLQYLDDLLLSLTIFNDSVKSKKELNFVLPNFKILNEVFMKVLSER